MSAQERGLTPELLQARADAIITSYQRMIGAGLPVDGLRAMERQYPREHRDMLQVFLGLKPVAGFLKDAVLPFFLKDDNYFRFMPTERGIGIYVMADTRGCVWSPAMVEKIGRDRKNEALIRQLLIQNVGFANPYSPSFCPFFQELSSSSIGQAGTALAGQMYGFPRSASSTFASNLMRVHDAKNKIREKADQWRIDHSISPGLSIQGIIEDKKKKNELLSLAVRVGFDDAEILRYIGNMRYSDTPGTPYVTDEPTISKYERDWMKRYNSSGIDRKLARLLD